MFVYKVKVEELTAQSLSLLKLNIHRNERNLHWRYPIRELNVVEDMEVSRGDLDIYLALDDIIDGRQVRRLIGEIEELIDHSANSSDALEPRMSAELIQI